MMDWQENNITKSALRKKLTDTEIENNIKLKISICLPALFCHTQAFERTVKLETGVSQKMIGSKNRDGYIKDLSSSRSKLPQFNTK